jgi:hypothetical protein
MYRPLGLPFPSQNLRLRQRRRPHRAELEPLDALVDERRIGNAVADAHDEVDVAPIGLPVDNMERRGPRRSTKEFVEPLPLRERPSSHMRSQPEPSGYRRLTRLGGRLVGMKRPVLLLLGLAATLAPCQGNVRSVRNQLAARYATIYRCYLRMDRDSSAMRAVLAPEYSWLDRAGKRSSREQVLRAQDAMLSKLVRCSVAKVRIDHLTVRGDSAVAVVTDRLVEQHREGGKVKRGVSSMTTRDTWRLRGKEWFLVKTEELAPASARYQRSH